MHFVPLHLELNKKRNTIILGRRVICILKCRVYIFAMALIHLLIVSPVYAHRFSFRGQASLFIILADVVSVWSWFFFGVPQDDD